MATLRNLANDLEELLKSGKQVATQATRRVQQLPAQVAAVPEAWRQANYQQTPQGYVPKLNSVPYQANQIASRVLQPFGRAQQWMESGESFALPQVPKAVQNVPVAGMAANIGRDVLDTLFSQGIVNPSLDTGKSIAYVINGMRGQQTPNLQLKSAPGRIGQQVGNAPFGQQMNMQNLLGDIGQTVEPMLLASGGGKALSAGKAALGKASLKSAALQGLRNMPRAAAHGLAYGTASGLDKNRDVASIREQVMKTAPEALTSAAMFSIIAGATPIVSYGGKKAVKAIVDKVTDPSTKQALAGQEGFLRIGAKKGGRPDHQFELEEAFKKNDMDGAQKIISKMSDDDPYKATMQNVLNSMRGSRVPAAFDKSSGVIKNPALAKKPSVGNVVVTENSEFAVKNPDLVKAVNDNLKAGRYDEVMGNLSKFPDEDGFKKTVQKYMTTLGKDKAVSDKITALTKSGRIKYQTMTRDEIIKNFNNATKYNNLDEMNKWAGYKEMLGNQREIRIPLGDPMAASTVPFKQVSKGVFRKGATDTTPASMKAYDVAQPKPLAMQNTGDWVQDLEINTQNMLKNQKGFVKLGEEGFKKQNKNYLLPNAPKSEKVVEQAFKTEKFNLNPSQTKALEGLQKEMGLSTRGVRSFEQMQTMAKELGTNPKKLLQDIEKGRITDKEVVALGQQINTSSQRIAQLTKQIKANPLNKTAQAQLAAEEELLQKSISKRITGGTEAGRAVVAFKIIANRNLDRAYWLDKAQRQIGVDKPMNADTVTAINDLIKKKDTLGLANFINTLGESSGADKAIGLWKAGLLTNPTTHVANVTSNTGFGALETVKDIPAALFDKTRALVTGGKRAKTFDLNEITSQPSGALRGLKQAGQYMKEGVDERDIGKVELPRKLRFGDSLAGKTAQKYTDMVFGALGAEDKVFREAAFNRAMVERAKVAKINGDISDDIYKAVVKDPNQVATNPLIKKLQEGAYNDALRATFNKENAIATGISRFKNQSEGTKVIGEAIAPFVRTPANVGEAFLDYTPFGFAKGATKAVWGKLANKQYIDNRELAESFGRSATGLPILLGGFELAKRGLVTGSTPTSPSERSQWELEGKKPNSVFVNGEWRHVNRFSPWGNLLVLAADLNKAGKNPEDLTPATLAQYVSKGLLDTTFLQGASGAIKAITDPATYGENWAERTAASAIPSIVARISQATDTKDGKQIQREADGFVENIVARTPFRKNLPEKLNALGDTATYDDKGLLGALFDPTNPSESNKDPLVNEFKRVEYNLNKVGKTLAIDNEKGADKLEPHLQREYQKRAGKYIKEMAPQVINSNAYKNADLETQKDLITSVVDKAKAKARNEIKAGVKTGELNNNKRSLLNIPEAFADGGAGGQVNAKPSGLQDIEYVNDDGKFETIKLSQFPDEPELSGMEALDKKLKSSYTSALTTYENNLVKAVKLGKLSTATAEKKLQEIAEIKTSMKAPAKGRSGSRVKRSISVPTTKIAAPKFSLPKRSKTPAVKVSSIRGATKKPNNKSYQRLFTIRA